MASQIDQQVGQYFMHWLLSELFELMDNYNKEIDSFTNEMAKIVCKYFLKESRDDKKATVEYLSSQSRVQSWKNTNDEEKKFSQETRMFNDPQDLYFGVFTHEIRSFDNMSISNVKGIQMCKKKGDLTSRYKQIKMR